MASLLTKIESLAAIPCLALAACGGGSAEERQLPEPSAVAAGDNHGYGWQYDAIGTTGLKLRYSPTYPSDSPLASVATYEQALSEVKACSGLDGSAAFVIAVPFGTLGEEANGSPYAGKYFPQPALVVVSGFAANDLFFYYRHELVHHLLFESTGDPNGDHASPLFARCS